MLFPRTLAVVATLISLVAAQKSVFSAAAEWIDGITQYRPSAGHDLSSEVPFQAVLFPVLKYTVMEGFFKQSDERTDDRTYDAVSTILFVGTVRETDPFMKLADSFGLLLSGDDRWARFKQRLELLNQHAPRDVAYKVLYLARHGQGQHNVAGMSFPSRRTNSG